MMLVLVALSSFRNNEHAFQCSNCRKWKLARCARINAHHQLIRPLTSNRVHVYCTPCNASQRLTRSRRRQNTNKIPESILTADSVGSVPPFHIHEASSIENVQRKEIQQQENRLQTQYGGGSEESNIGVSFEQTASSQSFRNQSKLFAWEQC